MEKINLNFYGGKPSRNGVKARGTRERVEEDERHVREIVRENERRLKGRAFDAITGEGSPGDRVEVEFNCPVLGGGVRWLPRTMMRSEVGRSVIESGSVSRFARERGLTPERVGELFELVRLRHDFPYWAAQYARIRSKSGGENIALILNNAQRKLIASLEEMRTAGQPIRAILLKSRQWGGSTVIQLYMVWHQLVLAPGLNSLTVAHQNSATEEIRSMMKRVVDEYPEALMRVDFEAAERGLLQDRTDEETRLKSVGRSGNTLTLPARNCDFKIGTAERPDSARGGAYSLIHLSEVGIWRTTEGKNPGEIVTSTTSGVLAKPGTLIVLESTAKGKRTYFHKEYVAAKKGRAQWKPVFIAWYDIEQYALPIENKPEFASRLFENRESDEKDERSESGRYLWELWEAGASLEAINWYIWERRKYDCSSSMASEYPSNDEEAFTSSDSMVFSPETAELLTQNLAIPEIDENGKMKIEVWEKFKPTSRYFSVASVGGAEIGERTVAVVFKVDPEARMSVTAQLTGHVSPREAARGIRYLAGEYGNCPLVFVSEGRNLIATGHTRYCARILSADYPVIHFRSRNVPVFELDGTERIMMTDSLKEAIADRKWHERSPEAVEAMTSLQAETGLGYFVTDDTPSDLIWPRVLAAHIVNEVV